MPSREQEVADDCTTRAADDRQIFALLYGELRALAQAALRGERSGHTLGATALVNEAYLKLGGGQIDGRTTGNQQFDRARFFAMAATAMRRILVDHARTRGRQKRGGGRTAAIGSALDDLADDAPQAPIDAIAMDDAIRKLASEHAAAARVVEMRFFGGLDEATIALALNVNERTVRRHWVFAKAWLARHLGGERPRPE